MHDSENWIIYLVPGTNLIQTDLLQKYIKLIFVAMEICILGQFVQWARIKKIGCVENFQIYTINYNVCLSEFVTV